MANELYEVMKREIMALREYIDTLHANIDSMMVLAHDKADEIADEDYDDSGDYVPDEPKKKKR